MLSSKNKSLFSQVSILDSRHCTQCGGRWSPSHDLASRWRHTIAGRHESYNIKKEFDKPYHSRPAVGSSDQAHQWSPSPNPRHDLPVWCKIVWYVSMSISPNFRLLGLSSRECVHLLWDNTTSLHNRSGLCLCACNHPIRSSRVAARAEVVVNGMLRTGTDRSEPTTSAVRHHVMATHVGDGDLARVKAFDAVPRISFSIVGVVCVI